MRRARPGSAVHTFVDRLFTVRHNITGIHCSSRSRFLMSNLSCIYLFAARVIVLIRAGSVD